MPDREHLQRATDEGRILVTHNCADFEELHREFVNHPGMVAIYQDNDRQRDMAYDIIVKALERLEASGIALDNGFHVLNAWR